MRQAELASFFKKHHIYLKEQLMDKRLFELEYLADMFLKMNEVLLLSERKQLTKFIANYKI